MAGRRGGFGPLRGGPDQPHRVVGDLRAPIQGVRVDGAFGGDENLVLLLESRGSTALPADGAQQGPIDVCTAIVAVRALAEQAKDWGGTLGGTALGDIPPPAFANQYRMLPLALVTATLVQGVRDCGEAAAAGGGGAVPREQQRWE